MIEHKYRYWDEQEKKMVYFTLGELLAAYNDEGNYPDIEGTDLFRLRNDIDTKKVMNYILTNKQGLEIYEGDIVLYPPFASKGTVTWIAHNNAYLALNYNKTEAYALHDEYEVLGNTHEMVEGT